MIRKAEMGDIARIEEIYATIHDSEEAGETHVSWVRGVYPTRELALSAMEAGELFVLLDGGVITACAIINQNQFEEYKMAPWRHPAEPHEVMVLHTLAVDRHLSRRGYGKEFLRFYESYAKEQGCKYLRMDTNHLNTPARALYRWYGFTEVGIIPCDIDGIPHMELMCYEKVLK